MTAAVHPERNIQPKPLLIAVGVHVVLLLLFFFWRYSVPEKNVSLPDMGMEVNLGTSADGSGFDQPMDIEDPAASASNTARNAQSAASTNPDMERGNDDDAPAISETSRRPANNVATNADNRRAGTSNATSNARTQPTQKPRFVYPGSNGKGGNSAAANVSGTQEGNTTGTGDRGVPGGTPGSSNYTGSPGTGTGGISFRLDGRNIIAFPPKEARFREGGRVVVRVTVDREGDIVNKQIVSSTNTELNPIALQKLKAVRFNKSETAPAEQFGNITFEFKTRQ